jgi:hypothetical protein
MTAPRPRVEPNRGDFVRTGLSILVTLVSFAVPVRAQSVDTLPLTSVGADPHWQVVGRATSIVDIKGTHALRVSEAQGMGIVWLDGYDFTDGVIELDILGRSAPVQGSFVGVAFHVVDGQTHEAVYFRPFNFRAADSAAHSHAVQYVSDPEWPWYTLRSERPGRYEAAVVPEPDGDEWFHVRVVVQRPKIEVFVNGAAGPCLVVEQLSPRTHGSVGVWVGNGSGGYFANLRVERGGA